MSNMKLLQYGNSKLNNTLAWSIPATTTICGRTCPGCYSHKLYRIYPSILQAHELRYQVSLEPTFIERIVTEIKATKKPFKYIRIHASAGEFYSNEYIDKWTTIAKSFPQYIFYAYTKRLSDFDFTSFKALPNVVLINSLHFNRINYGKPGTEPPGAFVCPASKSIKCGVQCSFCMSKQAQHNGVYFHQH